MLSVSIVIVSYGSHEYLPACLKSLLENVKDYPQAHVTLVENKQEREAQLATAKAAGPFLKQGLNLLNAPTNLGYGGGANWGWPQAGEAEVYIVLNPDMSFPQGWLPRFMVPFERDKTVGVVGCKLLSGDGKIQHAGGLTRYDLALAEHFGVGEPDDGRWDQSCEVEFVTGAALGISRKAMQALNGFDVAYFPGYYEDVDLCWRAQEAGFKVWYEAAAVAYHYEGGTFGRQVGYYRTLHRNRLRFVLQHYDSARLLHGFLPAEKARLQGTMDEMDRQAGLAVYHAAAQSFINALEK
ncbi:MAG TPA: glycosyltransferase family 2 protein [Chloroflexia bacterium]|nr:glycosyltransferase family 2 protein [Chloroflexia bacterium]